MIHIMMLTVEQLFVALRKQRKAMQLPSYLTPNPLPQSKTNVCEVVLWLHQLYLAKRVIHTYPMFMKANPQQNPLSTNNTYK